VIRVSILLAALFATAPGFAGEPPRAPDGYEQRIKPFFAQYCTKCHGEKKQKGALRLDTLGYDFSSPMAAMRWIDVMDRINNAEMPPESEVKPKPETAAHIAEWIAAQLTEADAAQQAGLGEKVSFRRLTREEYRNTIRDLLGVTFDVADPAGLPEDPDWQGFERVGSVLTISPAHVEKYLAAAEAVLNEALATGPEPKRQVVHWSPFDLRWYHLGKTYAARGNGDKLRVDIVPNNGADGNPGSVKYLDVPTGGEFIVRVKLSALRPAGGIPPRLRVYAVSLDRVLFERDVEAPENQPATIEFRTHLPAGSHPIRVLNAVPGPNPEGHASRPTDRRGFFDLRARQPWQIKLTDDTYRPLVPFILLDFVEWEGPVVESWPTPAHRRIFFGGEGVAKDIAYAREILARFAERAFRRPVLPAEVNRLTQLFEKSLKLGDNFESSVRTALFAVLCSKSFLYLVEGQQSGTEIAPASSPARLSDWELASRLSYCLWSTMPDERLLNLARAGKLHEPDVLRAEVRRMLKDDRVSAFNESFPRQWLQLRRLGMFPPDRKLYPDYDEYLEKSMVAETIGFFREVMTRNLGLGQFLDSDWTMLNRRLAGHYGIARVDGEDFQRVSLQPQDHRGGLLTQASILSLTSDGTRHRPVHRGKWILESIIGKAPPPPPANVPAIKTSAPGEQKASLRDKLKAHRQEANCMACHRKIDPLGLAFDNYDAVGHWRTLEIVTDGTGANPPIDASGELPDGRRFVDSAGLKKLMLADLDKFAAGFTEKLATYGLRRGMTFADRTALNRIVELSKSDQYKLASLIETFMTSDLFQKR
jgi:mono/diheme cytochrome c family protein